MPRSSNAWPGCFVRDNGWVRRDVYLNNRLAFAVEPGSGEPQRLSVAPVCIESGRSVVLSYVEPTDVVVGHHRLRIVLSVGDTTVERMSKEFYVESIALDARQ